MNKEQIAIELTKIYIQNSGLPMVNKDNILKYYNYFLTELSKKEGKQWQS